ncbi:MAG: tetratricopeptide repeat protein [Archangium sp.]|nr:tetratricopeptide repeat protein [Archangium sp.]
MKRTAAVLAALAVFTGCEEPAQAEARKKVQSTIDYAAHGRAELSAGRPEQAVIEFKKAINVTPEDVSLYLMLADAYRLSGNEAAAALTLKQAESVSGTQDPSIRRQRAELLRKMHQTKAAIVELIALRDEDLLTDPEILDLAKLLAHRQRIDEAFKTLERIQLRSPDDPEAKVCEAEILFVKGDEVVAAKIIDRLLTENPGLTSARLVRARYFFNARELAQAEQDLAMIDAKDAKREDVLALRALVLNELGRSEEAAALLEELVNENPKDAEVLALLAETRLEQGKAGEAQMLVDKVLAMEPRWARALYVRGRAVEMQDRLEDALNDYQSALLTDSTFAPALKRIWRVQMRLNNKPESIAALEQLFLQNEIDSEEKVQLAKYYAETWANVDRGEKLINEALKKDPTNKEYLAIKAKLTKGAVGLGKKKPNTGGIQIIKGGRR